MSPLRVVARIRAGPAGDEFVADPMGGTAMSYTTNDELPESVKNNLPHHAQVIYREAYNDAWSRFSYLTSRKDGRMLREENAHKAGWRAVRAEYERRGGEWVRIDRSGSFEIRPGRRQNHVE